MNPPWLRHPGYLDVELETVRIGVGGLLGVLRTWLWVGEAGLSCSQRCPWLDPRSTLSNWQGVLGPINST